MKIKNDFRQLPNSTRHHCFACSPVNHSGLQMRFFTNENAVFSRVTVPAHLCGWNNLAHGGVVSTILDEVMSWAALYLLKRITLTQSMAVEFIKPVHIRTELEAEGNVLELKGKRDAVLEGLIYNSDGNVCARSTGKFKVFSPAVAKRLGIADEGSLEWFESIINIK
jgi:uncharacterized protein (TIGR00369 family)